MAGSHSARAQPRLIISGGVFHAREGPKAMNDPLPRPTLVQFAVSTLVIGLAVLAVAGAVADARRGAPYGWLITIAFYAILLMVTQGLGTFGRSHLATSACIMLLGLPAVLGGILCLDAGLSYVVRDQYIGPEKPIPITLVFAFLFVAAVSNGRWAMTLKTAKARRPGFINRYSFQELTVIFTMLCVIAAVFARFYRTPL
jgi:hypothetical protein